MTAGRPRKLYLQGQARITTSLSVKEEIRDLIPREKKISREFEEFIVWKYGEKEENDLQSLIKQREELLSKLGRIDFDIRDIERRIKDKEEMRKSLKIQEKYKANVLRSLLSKYKAHPPELNSDWLLRTYGISFTVPKGNPSPWRCWPRRCCARCAWPTARTTRVARITFPPANEHAPG
uniref:hypothetical protein n=1 Tax=Metallibacterium scheffleri TaxID=993689 RepID=UPI0023F26A2D